MLPSLPIPMEKPLLGGLTPDEFLATYWQKKPLLVRGALPDFTSPLAPEELAGLALEEDVAARLILQEGGAYPWELRYGPFSEEDFTSLPATHWTLLVQEVDRLVPDVAEMLDAFRFIPDWRVDDVMASYAPEGGGVGAHVDQYDVFLVQGLGHRRWQIAYEPVEDERIVPDLDVRMLADFEPDEDWVLGPGDMLYLPPRIAHYGVALDDCITYSVGFRAPSHAEIMGGFAGYLSETLGPARRYSDPDLTRQEHPGEITEAALARVADVLRDLSQDDEAIRHWFGRQMTEPKRDRDVLPLDEPYEPEEIADALNDGAALYRSPNARLAFTRHPEGTTSLFIGGEEISLDANLAFAAPLLTRDPIVPAEDLTPHLGTAGFLDLVTELVNDGVFELAES